MKQILIVLGVLVAAIVAEPPYYRVRSLNGRSAQFNIQQDDQNQNNPNSGPYAPSGWRPTGQRFELPPREESTTLSPDTDESTPTDEYGLPKVVNKSPENTYGPPQNTYGPPQNTYGPPQNAYGPPQPPVQITFTLPQNTYGPPQTAYGGPDERSKTTSTTPTTTNDRDVEETTDSTQDKEAKTEKDKEKQDQGPYYIILPESKLQKYYYGLQADPRLSQYSSSYSAYSYQPYTSPYYVYTPQYYYQWI